MGRRNPDIPFEGSLGINEAISPFQVEGQGATIAQNVYFEKFGTDTLIAKRKGMTRINSTAAGGDILGLYQFNFNDNNYFQAFSDDGVMQSINITTGAIADITTGLLSTFKPDMAILGNKAFFTLRGTTTTLDACDATTDWTAAGDQATTLSLNTDKQAEGSGCLKIIVDAALGAVGNEIGAYKNFASFSGSAKNILFKVSAREGFGAPFAGPSGFDTVRVTLYSDNTGTNGSYWDITTDVNGDSFPASGFEWITIKVDPNSTADGDIGGGLTVTDIERVLIVADDWPATAVANSQKVELYIDDIYTEGNTATGLAYATDNSGHTSVTDSNRPGTPNYVETFESRLFVADDNTVFWSNTGDGTDFSTDSSSVSIDDGDGDTITGMAVLGSTLFVFKKYSIHKIIPTSDTIIPYRRVPVYSGTTASKGIGCIAKDTIQHVILGGLQDNYWAKQEYLYFLSANGLYAINEVTSAIKIDVRVSKTMEAIAENYRPYAFSCSHPEKDQFWLFYPTGSTTYTTEQLIYGAHSKQWSKYDFSNMTAATAYRDTNKTYVIMGNKDGFLFKHDYQTSDALADYADNDNAGADVAIDAQWRSAFISYKNNKRTKQMLETGLTAAATTTDCPITVTVDNEEGTTTAESFSTTSSVEWINSRLPTKLSGQYLRHKFSNANVDQSMKIYLWSAMMKQGRDTR